MVGLEQLVDVSLARHGVSANLDPGRLQWSSWFGCEDRLSIISAPAKPGLFALAEEIVGPGEFPCEGGKRMLALFRIAEAEDLGLTLGRLFLSGNPEREGLDPGRRYFARYAVLEGADQRHMARVTLERWMAASAELALGASLSPDAPTLPDSSNKEAQNGPQLPLAAGF